MDILLTLIQWTLHLDVHLAHFTAQYGLWAYALLFTIIFAETGFIIVPFLPGDSLLFAAGALTATIPETLNIHLLFALLAFASIAGNSINYAIGLFFGKKIVQSRLVNPVYLSRAKAFYQRHGGKTLLLARFMPIIRTFVPFVAGISFMRPLTFLLYNVIGGFLWVGGLLYSSYFFGHLPFIKNHFGLLVLIIITVSLIPVGLGLLRELQLKSVTRRNAHSNHL